MTAGTPEQAALVERIRRALGVGDDDTARVRTVEERLTARSPRGPALARNQVDGAERLAAFTDRLTAQAGTVEPLPGPGEIPAAVRRYLAGQGIDADAIAIGEDAELARLDWGDLSVTPHAGPSDVAIALTRAAAGISETGTLAFLSSPAAPPLLNFVAETHIAVVAAADIVASYEEFWARMRRDHGGPTETLNFISGPSKTGDIEQTMYYGAHGPHRLHVLIPGALGS